MTARDDTVIERFGFTPRTWWGIWTAIGALIAGAGGAQQLAVRSAEAPAMQSQVDHDAVIALVAFSAAAEKQMTANRDNIAKLGDVIRENNRALAEQIDKLSGRIDRVLERGAGATER